MPIISLREIGPGVVLAAIALTLVSGFADAYGFTHAARMWDEGRLVLGEGVRSAAGFALGVLSYWLVLRPLQSTGVVSALTQTLGWFGVTIIGVAVLSGDVSRWSGPRLAVALLVAGGVGWLLATEESR
jgi:hypothetical protein